MNIEETQQAKLIAESCRILGTLDITKEALGHVSMRSGDEILIKAKGPGEVGLRYTEARDIIKIDYDADKIEGPDDLQPPGESYLHIWIYKYRPDVNCVIHMHPEDAILLSICDKPLIPITVPSARLMLDGVADFPRALMIHDHALGEELARTIGDAATCLMRGHGVTITGSSVEEATVRTAQFAEYTTMLCKAYMLGNPQPLSEDDMRFAEGEAVATNKKRGTPGGALTVQSTWRYFRSLAYEKSGHRQTWT